MIKYAKNMKKNFKYKDERYFRVRFYKIRNMEHILIGQNIVLLKKVDND